MKRLVVFAFGAIGGFVVALQGIELSYKVLDLPLNIIPSSMSLMLAGIAAILGGLATVTALPLPSIEGPPNGSSLSRTTKRFFQFLGDWSIRRVLIGLLALLIFWLAFTLATISVFALIVRVTNNDGLNLSLLNSLPSVDENSDWSPKYKLFDGVEMALVPSGCFLMGREGVNAGDEQPTSSHCLNLFWIDVTEVTNEQFTRLNFRTSESSRWKDPFLPRENVTWIEARDFCWARGTVTRLPTEREWEYAARGPSNFLYPWGNNLESDNFVSSWNSNTRTAAVRSKPGGASWVGAMDMLGNVWEWTSSRYFLYPYVPEDGREVSSDDNLPRSVRGGSWSNGPLQVVERNFISAHIAYSFVGFRCVRDFQPGDL